jgi:hypothetical protein
MKKLMVLMATLLATAGSAFAQIGTIDKDLVFTPVTPCRLFDTRPSQGGTGAIAAAGVKNLLVWGQSSYAAQGGSASNCDLLAAGSNVAAVAVNLTVITPATGGYITAYPFGTALPTAATVNFVGGDIVRGNFTVAKVNQGAGLFHLTIYSSSLADVVGDVVGFYSRPVSAGSLECVNSTLKSVSIAANSKNLVSANACPVGYTTVSATCDAGFVVGVQNGGFGMSGNNPAAGVFCTYNNSTGNAHTTHTAATCCRIPGR